MTDEATTLLSDGEAASAQRQSLAAIQRRIAISAVGLVAVMVAAVVIWWVGVSSAGGGSPILSQIPAVTTASMTPSHPTLERRVSFLLLNVMPESGLPLSYKVTPDNYFQLLPDWYRAPPAAPAPAGPCGGVVVPGANWDRYNWQTEQMLVRYSCNIYDASVGSIALALGGHPAAAAAFWRVLQQGHTAHMGNIRATAPCRGRESTKECVDTSHSGACGVCYGDSPNITLRTPRPEERAWFFRTLSDYWAFPNTLSELCPERNVPWTWVDFKAVLGDNAWASLTGPLHTLWLRSGGSVHRIVAESSSGIPPELQLALNFVPTVMAMTAGNTGGVYFCPHNTFYGWVNVDLCSQVSVENNVSLLGGLKALRYLLRQIIQMAGPRGGSSDSDSDYAAVLQNVDFLIEGLYRFLHSAWDKDERFFRTGGMYDVSADSFAWDPAVNNFAVDCQTWTGTVLGPTVMDGWFGRGTALKLWETTKALSGFDRQPSGMVKGVGYTYNSKDQVCSGEWTFGAANWLMVMASEHWYTPEQSRRLKDEARFMARFVQANMTVALAMPNATASAMVSVEGTQYANKHYLIPPSMGGWVAYPLPSRASTAWSVFWDLQYNPFHLMGKHDSRY